MTTILRTILRGQKEGKVMQKTINKMALVITLNPNIYKIAKF